jgi:hypothetical protein
MKGAGGDLMLSRDAAGAPPTTRQLSEDLSHRAIPDQPERFSARSTQLVGSRTQAPHPHWPARQFIRHTENEGGMGMKELSAGVSVK